MWTSVLWEMWNSDSVSMTWADVVFGTMVLTVETGISLMELDCLSPHLLLIPLRFPGGGDIYEVREAQRVYLHRRNNPTSPVGIYRCDISVYDYTIV